MKIVALGQMSHGDKGLTAGWREMHRTCAPVRRVNPKIHYCSLSRASERACKTGRLFASRTFRRARRLAVMGRRQDLQGDGNQRWLLLTSKYRIFTIPMEQSLGAVNNVRAN